MNEAVQSHRAATVSAALGVVGTGMSLLGWWRVPSPLLHEIQGLGLFVSGAALILLWRQRAAPSAAICDAIFLADLVPTVIMLWIAESERASEGGCWVPYEASKLSVLTLAMIAPPRWWIGVTAILMFAGSAAVHHHVTPAESPAASNEPLGILAYGAFAVVLLGYRQRGLRLRAELSHARAAKMAMERVGRVALSLRDLANTPTQTLELICHEIPARDPRLHVLAARMRRALNRLRRLDEILSRYGERVSWDESSTSFDAEAEAEALLVAAEPPRGQRSSRAPHARPRRRLSYRRRRLG